MAKALLKSVIDHPTAQYESSMKIFDGDAFIR